MLVFRMKGYGEHVTQGASLNRGVWEPEQGWRAGSMCRVSLEPASYPAE